MSTGASAEAQTRTDRLLERATRFARDGRPARAAALLRIAAQRLPVSPRVAEAMAHLVLAEGGSDRSATPAIDPAEVDRALASAVDASSVLTPEGRALALLRARVAVHRGGLVDALDILTPLATPEARDTAAALRDLAARALRAGDGPLASLALTAARRATPTDPALLRDVALLHFDRGELADALGIQRTLLARDPADLETRRDLAATLLAEGSTREALELYRGLAERPAEPSDLLALAEAELEAGFSERAIASARAALAVSPPGDAEAALVLAAALLERERPDAARQAFEEALRRRPGDVRALEGLRSLGRTPAP